MEAPVFKSFQKDSMIPENILSSRNNAPTNISLNINLEENTISPLIVNRVKNNFGKHNYVIYSDNHINNCLTYIRNISNLPLIEDSFDILDVFDLDKYKEDSIYIYDLRQNAIKNIDIAGNSTLNFILQNIIDNTQGIIIISDTHENVPNLISTLSNLVFIDNDIKSINNILSSSASLRLPDKVNNHLKGMICINKTSLWTKLALF